MSVRIAICGIHIEASTFSPHRSTADDFEVRRGSDLIARYPFMDEQWARDVQWVPVLHARALPGGQLVPAVFDAWRDEILAGLRAAGRLDGVLFDIHGAMAVEGRDDAEGELASAIREVVGPDAVIAAPMDLHGNVSEALFAAVDLLTCYRTAPHIDTWETRERSARQLVRAIEGRRPGRALVHLPFLLPGEMTSTRVEPARTLYRRVAQVADLPGVWDAAFWIGFAWADEPRCKAAIVVSADDAREAARLAVELGEEVWSRVADFGFVAPVADLDTCLTRAFASDRRPFVISDSGDNPGAGGADDVTFAAAAVLGRPEAQGEGLSVVVASIVDPDAVDLAHRVGVGASSGFEVGGHIDATPPGTIRADFTVGALGVDPHGGRVALLRRGGVGIIVTSRRDQYATLGKFRLLGIEPEQVPVLVVKIGYLEPELYELASDWLMALTPGGVDQDLVRLGHGRIDRPMVPFDAAADAGGPVLVGVIPG